MTDKGLFILSLDSPVVPTYAAPNRDAWGRWATLSKDGDAVGTLWTDSDKGFGFLSTGAAPEITKEIRFYVQTSARAGVWPLVAYGAALRIFPEQFDLIVTEFHDVLGTLFRQGGGG
ncbi:MAG: hypothetical protein ACJ71Z_04615 [Aeromicrobium sp.]